MLNDIRFAFRTLARRKAFFFLAASTLALGIGANTTVFSVVHGVLLRPFPYQAPERLGILWHEFGEGAQFLPAIHPLDYQDYRERSRLFEGMTIAAGTEEILGGTTRPELVDVGLVAADFFPFLGIAPALGRGFRPEEDVVHGPKVVLLSHGLWQRRFGGDPGIVGRTIELAGAAHEVVGVMPESFHLLLPAETFRLKDSDVWRPVQIDYARLPPRNYTGFTVFVRLAAGVGFEAAQQELSGIAAQIRSEQPVHAASHLRVSLVPFQSDVVKGARRGLLLLMAAVGFVLVIACVNVALLMLARGRGRERELVVRAAVGASRWRVARLVLAESLVIALAGGALGIALAHLGLALVRGLAAAAVPRLHQVMVDGPVMGFVVGVSMVAALGFGILPAFSAARTEIATALLEVAGRAGSRRQGRTRDLLVAGQVALSLVLVVGAGLMVRSFGALAQARPGFDPVGVLTMRVSIPGIRTAEQALSVHRDIQRHVEGLPGVRRAASVSLLPLTGQGPLQPYAFDAETARHWESVSADEVWATPGYFETLGATLLAGRDFIPDDYQPGRRRIVIDDTLARRAFHGNAVGQSLQLEPEGTPESFFEVVGVVGHMNMHDLTRPLLPQIYRPNTWDRFSLVVRTAGPAAEGLAAPVRHELARIDPGIAVEDVRTLESIVDGARGQMRLAATLMSVFGALALALAAIGIYGVFTYAVGERVKEMAIRLALGAAPSGIRRMILARGLRLIAASLGVGALGAALLGRAMGALLYGVSPLDPSAYALGALLLAGVALLACWIPAARAARVEPLAALRQD